MSLTVQFLTNCIAETSLKICRIPAPLASSIKTKNLLAKFENILSFFSTYRQYFKHFFLLVDRTSNSIECLIIFYRFSFMYEKYFSGRIETSICSNIKLSTPIFGLPMTIRAELQPFMNIWEICLKHYTHKSCDFLTLTIYFITHVDFTNFTAVVILNFHIFFKSICLNWCGPNSWSKLLQYTGNQF